MKKNLLLIILFGFFNASSMDTDCGIVVLIDAIKKNELGIVKKLIENGASLEGSRSHYISTDYILTPLMVAASLGYYEIAKFLLDSGANTSTQCRECEIKNCTFLYLNFNYSDCQGITAKKIAEKAGHHNLATLIEEYEKKDK